MKKISKNRAGFSKPMLSILLAIVLFVGSLSVGSVAKGAGEDEAGTASVTETVETPAEEFGAEETQDSEMGSQDFGTGSTEEPEANSQGGTGADSTDTTEVDSTGGTGAGSTDTTDADSTGGTGAGSTDETGAGSLGELGTGSTDGTETGSQGGAGADSTELSTGSSTDATESAEPSETDPAELTTGTVTVKLDSGYDPDQYTNEENADGKLPERTTIINCNEGEEVSLPELSRFGYIFTGWKITSGKNAGTILKDKYTVTLDDCITGESGNTENTEETGKEEHVITMEAQWEAALDMLNVSLLADGSGLSHVLTAKATPDSDPPSVSCEWPDNMQIGELSYKIEWQNEQNKLKLISKAEMQKHQYDSEWTTDGIKYTANDTVAIELKLEKNGSTIGSIDLVDSNELTKTDFSVARGDTLTLTLHHSKVMTEEPSYTFTIEYTIFKADETGGSSGTDTSLKDEVTVNLKHSEIRDYTLKKDSTVPNDAWTVTYTDVSSNDVSSNDFTTTLGAASEAQVKYNSQVTLTPKSDNKLPITLTFKDDNGNVRTESLETLANETTASKDGFVCPKVKYENNKYTFAMPAKDVTISGLWELYLDNGTIELFEDGFQQEGQEEVYGNGKVSWPGDYRILQCADNKKKDPTLNVLKLYGDLTKRYGIDEDRKICLGNLNIDSNNSIELINIEPEEKEKTLETKVILTQEGDIQAKNILVPEGTSLTVKGAYNKNDPNNEANKSITLKPETDWSAIGMVNNNRKNGNITLENVDVRMTLKVPSVSSGIGSGNQDSEDSSGNVTIRNSKITVKEEGTNESNKYIGAWIGGAGVGNVNISGTTLLSEGISDSGARAVDGKEVHVTDSDLGTKENRLPVPIHGKNKLVIQNTNIYQTKRKK